MPKDDLISRQAAIAEAYDVAIDGSVFKVVQVETLYGLPTIDPVKRGKWMAIGNTGIAACECGYITDRYRIYNYCPKCGAQMEIK